MKILSLFWHGLEQDSINPEYFDGCNLTTSMFRRHIEFIVNNYIPISISDFQKIIKNKKLILSYKKPPVLLGFDDGFKNVIKQALPILKEFEVPAMLFVNGETLKNPDFVPWYVESKHLLRRTKKETVNYDSIKIDLVSKQGSVLLKHLFKSSFIVCKSGEGRERLLTNLAGLLNVERPVASELDEDMRFASKEDLSNLSSTSLLTIASHAMTHSCLASLTREEQVYELEQSNILLKKYCSSYYPTISYPDGSFNTDTISIAKRIYKSAFAVIRKSSYRNLYAYPRIGLQNETIQELAHIISPTNINLIRPIKRFLYNTGIRKLD